jgi:hypothetical protein
MSNDAQPTFSPRELTFLAVVTTVIGVAAAVGFRLNSVVEPNHVMFGGIAATLAPAVVVLLALACAASVQGWRTSYGVRRAIFALCIILVLSVPTALVVELVSLHFRH